eukprot:SAG11_NODE_37316_length_257_cov_0.981013_1_plen_21_part_10
MLPCQAVRAPLIAAIQHGRQT